MLHSGNSYANGLIDRNSYQGKTKEQGLNRIDLGFRSFNPTTGIFDRSDPMAEMTPDFSPFSYVFNNPVNVIDEFGLMGSGWNTRGREKTEAETANQEAMDNPTIKRVEITQNPGAMANVPDFGSKGWYKAADTASDFVPFLGSGKDIYQGYKNGNYLLLGLGVGGIVLDALTLGGGSIIKGTIKTVGKKIIGEGTEQIAKSISKRVLSGGKTFAQHKAARGGTKTLDFITTKNKSGQIVRQRISEEFSHTFITQRLQKKLNLPNWLVNNKLNVWKLNTIQHSLIDKYRFNFLRSSIKNNVGFFKEYNWFTKF